MNSRYMLKIEPTSFAHELDVRCEGNRGQKITVKVFFPEHLMGNTKQKAKGMGEIKNLGWIVGFVAFAKSIRHTSTEVE